MAPDPEELLAVGRVARAHGIKGEVAVRPLSEVGARFEPGSILRLGPGGHRRLTVGAARPHQGRLLVKFDEVGDRTEAEALRGALLLVPASESPGLPEDRFWVHDIVGMEVVTEADRSLGLVAEVLHNPGNDVWVTDRALIPAVREVVLRVEVGERRIVVREVPGLEAE